MLYILLIIIIYKIFIEINLLKILLFIEILGLIRFRLLLLNVNIDNILDGFRLFLFSFLVLEGILGLYGLILILNFSGKIFLNIKNL